MNKTNDIQQRVLMLERNLIPALEALVDLNRENAEISQWRIDAMAEIAVLEMVVEALISSHPERSEVKSAFDRMLVRDLDNFVEIGFADQLPVKSARQVTQRMRHHAWLWQKRLDR